ncbi:MAG: molybdopterin-binding/glycosyltransferase family 2 protein [Ancalomicrobiaceae bacterium]|nr:molybdopterin-binding/glycosyltransferase family 2 protein [Ancalomicrobiaceae bacterium]
MRFGPVATADSLGAILAHSVAAGGSMLHKGHRIGAADVDLISRAGLAEVIVARLEPDDIDEDAAAGTIAAALAGPGIDVEAAATGRANLFAEDSGLIVVDRIAIDALNAIDPGLTFATLPEFAAVSVGRMVATVKIIPFALPRAVVDKALALIASAGPLLRLARYRAKRVAVVSTLLPSLKPVTIDKTLKVLVTRLVPAGARLVADRRVAHTPQAVAEAIKAAVAADGADVVVVFGASAVVDRHDVVPAGVELAGGEVLHFGMPVDPGNLLLIGRLGAVTVIGAPGCARSPRENGFDWVLGRVLADIAVGPRELVGLGVGGLLMDIVSRPRPRQAPKESDVREGRRIAGIIMAAGRSSRMGGPNKLLAELDGKQLVAHAVDAALDSSASTVIVVTGHMEAAIRAALAGRAVTFVHNADFAEGMSTSLKAGIAAVPDDAEAALILLADMPRVTPAMIDRLIAAYDPQAGQLIVVPTCEGRRGNPVLWSRRFFPDLTQVSGDIGARSVIAQYPEATVEVELGAGVALDLDTAEAIRAEGGRVVD